MVLCILIMIIMYKFNYINEIVFGFLCDEIYVFIYKKNIVMF